MSYIGYEINQEGQQISGYTCMQCGSWISNNTVHYCSAPIRVFTASQDERIAIALERIADALEKIAGK